MDVNNNHTSVVIEFANSADSEGPKMNQIDFNDLNSSKDYVVDQIFCGDNVTVYTMFEIGEDEEKTSDKQITDVADSNCQDFQLYGAKSYRRGFLDGLKNRSGGASSRKITRSESLYSLRGHGRSSATSTCFSDIDAKFFFSEEYYSTYSEESKSRKELKKASKGVNTDIAFCPKLIGDVYHALSVNFLGSYEKTSENSPIAIPIISKGLIESDEISTSSSSNLDMDRKYVQKPPPEFLLVPLMMSEEGMLKQNQQEDKKSFKKEMRLLKRNENSDKNSSAHNINLEFSNKEKSNFFNLDLYPQSIYL